MSKDTVCWIGAYWMHQSCVEQQTSPLTNKYLMVELHRVQKSTSQHFLSYNSGTQQSSKHAIFVICLAAKPDLDWNSFSSKIFSELIWAYLYFIYSIWYRYHYFYWKKYWCLWLHVATTDRYISFQNSKNFKKIWSKAYFYPMGVGKGIMSIY